MKAFVFGSAALFVAGAATTIASPGAMPDVCGGPSMQGGTWGATSASFLALWMPMTVAMMMPSLAPALWRYRQAIAATGGVGRPALTLAAGAGYFFVWALLGLAVQPLEVVLARGVPALVGGAVVLGAGLVQLGATKRRWLARCRACAEGGASLPARASTAWLHGMHLGVLCALSCANLMAAALVAGMMDPWILAAVTTAITLERVARTRVAVAQATGIALIGAGLLLMARATASSYT